MERFAVTVALIVNQSAPLIVKKAFAELHVRAEAASAMVPRWQHVVMEKVYHPMVAKRQLLDNPNRPRLPRYKSCLQQGLVCIGELAEILGFKMEDATQIEHAEFAVTTFNNLDEVVKVMAAILH